MLIDLSDRVMLLEDKTTAKTPIPRKDLFALHARFSKSLAWMEARREIIEQRDRPGRVEPPFPESFLIPSRCTKHSVAVVTHAIISYHQTSMDHFALFCSIQSV
jgi:hypothetical protein